MITEVSVSAAAIGAGTAVVARLLYDGIKSKKNGNGNGGSKNGNNLNTIHTNLELLTKDVNRVDENVEDLKYAFNKFNDLLIEANMTLKSIQTELSQKESQFQNLFIKLMEMLKTKK